MLPKPKQYVTIPYSLYRTIIRNLKEQRRRAIFRDQMSQKLSPGTYSEDNRWVSYAKEVGKLLEQLERQSMLEERCG